MLMTASIAMKLIPSYVHAKLSQGKLSLPLQAVSLGIYSGFDKSLRENGSCILAADSEWDTEEYGILKI